MVLTFARKPDTTIRSTVYWSCVGAVVTEFYASVSSVKVF